MTDEEIERIEALVVRASAWAASRPLVSALSALLAEHKELLRRVGSAEQRLGDAAREIPEIAGPVDHRIRKLRDALRAQLAEAQAALEASASSQERAVAEAWEAGREAAAQACDEQARRLVNSETDTGDGEVWLRHASAAIRALAPKVT